MSRIGKKAIQIPSNVEINIQGNLIKAKGPKGELEVIIHPLVKFKHDNSQLVFSIDNPNNKSQVALWGTMRALTQNIITGVTEGFKKSIELNGVGFKLSLAGEKLNFALGFSHPVEVKIPSKINVKIEKQVIVAESADNQLLGQFIADIYRLKPHEPYKGKGFKIQGKTYRRLAGKTKK